jgi:excisionase family DNA binding protein
MPLIVDEIEWLSTLQVAEVLGLTTRTVYRLVDSADLPAYRFGRVIRFQLADVERFIERSRITPGSLNVADPSASAA